MNRIVLSYFISTIIIIIFLICGLFAIPSADDYFYANFVSDHGLLGAQVEYYFGWSGRYLATFLITLFSLTRYEHYWLVPWFCILLVSSSFYYFLYTIFYEIRDRVNLRLVSLSFVALYLSVTIAGYGHGVTVINEGYFWFSGAITYSGSLALYLILISSIIWLSRAKHKNFNFFLSTLLSFMVIGLNETAMFLTFITIIPLMFFYIHRIGKIKVLVIISMIIFASLVVIFAPGNEVRMQTSDGGNLFSALGICVEKLVQILFYFIFNPVLWLYVIVFDRELNDINSYISSKINLKYAYMFSLSLILFLYLPVAYSLNAGAPDRLISFIGFFAMIASLLYILHILRWLKLKLSIKLIVSFTILFSIIGSYFFLGPLRYAIYSLFNGSTFYQEHKNRNSYVKKESDNGNNNVQVTYIKKNKLLLFEDLKINDKNKQYARFYGANSVRVFGSIE
jgi:hypothetical protein